MREGGTALVTGGTGFIGGRLIEVLAGQCGIGVRALLRSSASGSGAFRAAAAGAEFAVGSLLDPSVLAEAVRGCDYVFHCAYGSHGGLAEQRRVTVEGTRMLARAAADAGVRHFVNLSTLITYGADTPAEVDERHVPARMWKWPYAVDKRDAEAALLGEHARSGLAVTNLRLGAIYGPYGPAFTIAPLQALAGGRVALVDDGQGVCNATYVDDVIQAMLLAAARDGTSPETFTIKGSDRVTWRQLHEAYQVMLGTDALVAMSRAEMRAARRAAARAALGRVLPEALTALKASAGFKAAVRELPLVARLRGRRAAPGAVAAPVPAPPPVQLIPEMMIDYYACTTEYRIDKAREQLGYAPEYDLARGMALTEAWARWAKLIPA